MSHAGTKLKYLCGIIEQFQKPKHSLAALCYMPASVLTQVIPICILTKMLSADWTPPCRWWLPLSCPGMCIAYHFDYLADQHIFFEKSSHWAGQIVEFQTRCICIIKIFIVSNPFASNAPNLKNEKQASTKTYIAWRNVSASHVCSVATLQYKKY